MSTRIITADHLCTLRDRLISEEKSPATIQKYMRDAQTFLNFAGNREITKTLVIDYKAHLLQCGYTA